MLTILLDNQVSFKCVPFENVAVNVTKKKTFN